MDVPETRELEYFVAVAEELHFGRAAERLGMSQPPLSRAVARLERRMNVRLFERTSRRVSLTPSGRVFLTEARRALDAVTAAVRHAQRAARPPGIVLAVRSGAGSGLLADLVRAERHTGLDVVFTRDQKAALSDGTADVALLCADSEAGGVDAAGLRTVEVAREAPVVLLPWDHPLARRRAVTTKELRREPSFTEVCPPVSLDEIVDRVAFGELIVVVGAGAGYRAGPHVGVLPVADLPETRLVLAWPDRVARPALEAFATRARTLAAGRAAAVDVS
ncbi:LysR family transcriptional regulator [Streptomyces sp. GC420]|uniref:LysR family transcriptional regulator n=1 Tax=Streptomyces sp. GC420 TaxID=2697568 RepID=UPI001415001F|nr:LysR family transcriptional regulator [Streptomyces sp. GC420]NBM19883.1 LysR family transcriptional regulator [Streptomyces sp. GC420]